MNANFGKPNLPIVAYVDRSRMPVQIGDSLIKEHYRIVLAVQPKNGFPYPHETRSICVYFRPDGRKAYQCIDDKGTVLADGENRDGLGSLANALMAKHVPGFGPGDSELLGPGNNVQYDGF
jgi:hypothetical protein